MRALRKRATSGCPSTFLYCSLPCCQCLVVFHGPWQVRIVSAPRLLLLARMRSIVRIQSAVRSPLEASRVSIIRRGINVLLWISCLPWSKSRSLFREYVCLQLKYMRSSLESHESRQSQLQGMMPNMRFMQKNVLYTQSRKTSCDASMVSSDTDTRHRRSHCSRLVLPEYVRAAFWTTRAAAAHEGQWRASSGIHSETGFVQQEKGGHVKKGITYLDGTRFGTRKTGLFEMPFLLVKLGKKGKLSWFRPIPKSEHSTFLVSSF